MSYDHEYWLNVARQINLVIGPWELLVTVRAIMLSVAVLLAKRAFVVKEWAVVIAAVLLVGGWLVNIPYRTLSMEPMRLATALLLSGISVCLLMLHKVLCKKEKELNTCGKAAVSTVPTEHDDDPPRQS